MNNRQRTIILILLAICLAILAGLGRSSAAPRHHHPPRHAHITKHAQSVDVVVKVPARLMAPRPPAVHRRVVKRHRAR